MSFLVRLMKQDQANTPRQAPQISPSKVRAARLDTGVSSPVRSVTIDMQMELHSAWHILLQHPAITQQQQLVCQLLCVSSSMRAALHAAAAGQVLCRVHGSSDVQERDDCWQPGGATVALLASTTPQPLTAVKAESFGLWLAQHACLLHTLDMTCKPGTPEAPLIAAAAAKGLTEAAAAAEGVAGRRGLLLQGYRGCWTDSILQQLPAASLTYLSLTDDLGQSTEMGQEFFKREDFGPLCRSAQASLERFVNLRHLGCLEDDYTNCSNVSGILPALRGMTKLTYLDIGLDRGMEHYMHCLPASLCVLHMAGDDEGYRLDLMDEENETHDEYEARWPPPMDISHLTALTALDLTRHVACVVQTGDVLPPNLQQLKVRDVRCWDPVLELTCLRSIRAQEVPMEVVGSMAVKLTNLQDVCISDAEGFSAAYFRAYAQLPMRKLGGLLLSASNLPQLSLLTGLTCLKANFHDPDLAQVDQYQQLGRLLKSMKHLVKLQVGKSLLMQEHMRPAWLATEAAALPLATTLAGLPALRSVFLHPLRFSVEACMALAAASALTRLELEAAGLRDFGVISMVMGMPHLQELGIQYSPDVTDAVMPVISKHLPALRRLGLQHTGVTRLGLAYLKEMQQLQQLEVCGKDVSEAKRVLGTGQVAIDGYCCNGGL